MSRSSPDTRRRAPIGLAALLSLAIFTDLSAKVAPAELSDVIAWSQVIVVGTVKSLATDSGGRPFAVVAVDTVWRGAPESTIRIALRPRSSCDTARAIVGERAIFFLEKDTDGQLHITHAGHGRMTIVGKQVSVSPMVIVPDDTERTDIGTRQVPFSIIAFYVQATVQMKGR